MSASDSPWYLKGMKLSGCVDLLKQVVKNRPLVDQKKLFYIIFSLCKLISINDAPKKLQYVQLWRTTLDIRDVWDRSTLNKDMWAQGISNIWDTHHEWWEFTKPGCWADPSMLAVGWVIPRYRNTQVHR